MGDYGNGYQENVGFVVYGYNNMILDGLNKR